MRNVNLKILLPTAGILLLVVSVLALQDVMAGIGLGIASLLIFGPDVIEKRGKTAGIIYSKNKSGHYTKGRVKGRNPNTDAQSANRQEHAKYMRLWKSQEVDQKAYNEYASLHPVQNKIGHTICLSGINWFLRFNRFAQKANPGCPTITTPPVKDTVFPLVTGVTVSASASPESVIVEPIKFGEYVEGMRLEVIATRPLSYGVSCPFGFRSIGVYDPQQAIGNRQQAIEQAIGNRQQAIEQAIEQAIGNRQQAIENNNIPTISSQQTVNGIGVTDDYVAKFGQLTAGMKIFVRVRLLMPTGEMREMGGGNTVVTV